LTEARRRRTNTRVDFAKTGGHSGRVVCRRPHRARQQKQSTGLTRQTTLNLKVVSWRLFFHRANREQSDDHVVEVRCRLERRLLGGRIIIVGTPNEDLADLKISIEIRSPQDKTTGGWLRYYPPISSADGVVDEKTGSGWVYFICDGHYTRNIDSVDNSN
jgi:hypothetical protein